MPGEIRFTPPLYGSPLGAPATYGAIDLPLAIEKAINRGLASVIPRLKPYGIDRAAGVHIDARTPLAGRLTRPLAEIRAEVLRPGLRIEVSVETLEARAV